MKKTYQTPVVLPTDFDLQQLLAGSLKTDASGNPYEDLSNPNETTATSGNLSRRSVWEDEDFDSEEDF